MIIPPGQLYECFITQRRQLQYHDPRYCYQSTRSSLGLGQWLRKLGQLAETSVDRVPGYGYPGNFGFVLVYEHIRFLTMNGDMKIRGPTRCPVPGHLEYDHRTEDL